MRENKRWIYRATFRLNIPSGNFIQKSIIPSKIQLALLPLQLDEIAFS